MNVRDLSLKLGVTEDRVRVYLREDRIPGAKKVGRDWDIPDDLKIGREDILKTPMGRPKGENVFTRRKIQKEAVPPMDETTITPAVTDKLSRIWGLIRESVKGYGDPGPFNPQQFRIMPQAPYNWTGDTWPLGLDELETEDIRTPAAQSVWATLYRQAAINMRIIPHDATVFGEFSGTVVSGWSCRFGNLDNEVSGMYPRFSPDGVLYSPWGYSSMEEFFKDPKIQERFKSCLDKCKKMEVPYDTSN